jgi:hypothetical protein
VKGATRPGKFVDDARPGDVHALLTSARQHSTVKFDPHDAQDDYWRLKRKELGVRGTWFQVTSRSKDGDLRGWTVVWLDDNEKPEKRVQGTLSKLQIAHWQPMFQQGLPSTVVAALEGRRGWPHD